MRTRKKELNIEAIQTLLKNHENSVLDIRPIIAVTMRESGCTFQDVADAMGFTRQMAETMVKKAQATL
jgi:transcriptional regulator